MTRRSQGTRRPPRRSPKSATSRDPNCLAMALKFVKLGFRVYPVWPMSEDGTCECGGASSNCKPGKHPIGELVPHGFKDATVSEKTVRHWLKRCPQANLGIVTGRASGVWVLDVDGDEGKRSLKTLKQDYGFKLPITVKVHSGGGGLHYYFKLPPGEIVTKLTGGGFMPSLDVLGDGTCVVVPPSIHASGDRYRFPKGRGLGEVDFKPAPPDLIRAINDKVASSRKASDSPGDDQHADGKQIPKHQRNKTLTSLGGALAKQQCSAQEIRDSLFAANSKRCRPPLADREVEGIARSIVSKYSSSTATVQIPSPTEQSRKIMATIGRRRKIGRERVPTGLDALDKALGGGVLFGTNTILVGPPGSTKSTLAADMVLKNAQDGLPILVIAAEGGVTEWKQRIACRLRGMTMANIHNGTHDKLLKNALAEIDELPIVVLSGKDVREVEVIGHYVQHIKKTHDTPPLVVVDYIQKLIEDGPDPRRSADKLSDEMNNIAETYDCPVLCLSSTSRGGYQLLKNKRINLDAALSMPKETGQFESDASLVVCIMLNRNWQHDYRYGVVAVPKNRYGREFSLWVRFDGQFLEPTTETQAKKNIGTVQKTDDMLKKEVIELLRTRQFQRQRDDGKTPKLSRVGDIAYELETKRDAVVTVIQQLVADGTVLKPAKKGEDYKLSPAALTADEGSTDDQAKTKPSSPSKGGSDS